MRRKKTGKSNLSFCYKIFESGNEKLLAIADKNIVGKTFKKGKNEITISKTFYGDSPVSEKDVKEQIENATSINGIGTNTIELLEELGLVKGGEVKNICGQPHVIVMKA